MSSSKIKPLRLQALLSEAEYRELRSLAILNELTIAGYVGWVLRRHLIEAGRPVEGSVKA